MCFFFLEEPAVNNPVNNSFIRNDHSATKLHIVFDASAHCTTELCLNDILEAGACL